MEDKNDHDLLIRVDTKLGTLIQEVQLLRDDSTRRLSSVEQNKLDKSEFNEFKLSIFAEVNKSDLNFNKELLERDKRHDEVFKSQDQRITRIERNMYIGIGILMSLQVGVPLILKYLFNF